MEEPPSGCSTLAKDKVKEWYEHDAALLDSLPLDPEQTAIRDLFEEIGLDLSAITCFRMRCLLKKPALHVAHSFEYKDGWHSLSKISMATFYEDAVLHQVGKARLEKWWALQPADTKRMDRTGAALTFWYAIPPLDSMGLDNAEEELQLPDAIQIGLRSTLLGEFEAVYCLTYNQTFVNMPPHVQILDATRVNEMKTNMQLSPRNMQLSS